MYPAHMATAVSQPSLTFFSLPLEIRMHIYELLLPVSNHNHNCSDPKRTELSLYRHKKHEAIPDSLTQLQTLLLVCKRMNDDEPIKQIFYRNHTFVVQDFAPEPLSDPFLQMIRENNETSFLDQFSWTDTMPLMRKMVMRLAPPNAIERNPHRGLEATPRQQRGLPAHMPDVGFRFHDGWCDTLGNLSVLGLHIYNAHGGELYGFEDWLFKTLWSLVASLPGFRDPAASMHGTGRYDSRSNWSKGPGPTTPPLPMVVIYIEKGRDLEGSARALKARGIVERAFPRHRFRYVPCLEALETPGFLERKRIAPIWGPDDSTDVDAEVIRKALDEYHMESRAL
ncbi:hypothetical protein V8F33_008684 [Rhypophila sp. PSN 637]